MAVMKDLITENDDIVILNGDYKNGLSNEQHIEDTLKNEKLRHYQTPLAGVGIFKYYKGNAKIAKIKAEIRAGLKRDRQIIKRLLVTKDYEELIIEVDANKTV